MKKRILMWAGVVFVWLVTIGCWFLSAWLGRGSQDWGLWWAGWAWLGVDFLTTISAVAITLCAILLRESSK